jgi:hypothetical protein
VQDQVMSECGGPDVRKQFIESCRGAAQDIRERDAIVHNLIALHTCMQTHRDLFVQADVDVVTQRVECLQQSIEEMRQQLQTRITQYEAEVQDVQRCLQGRKDALASCSDAMRDPVMQSHFVAGQQRMQKVIDTAVKLLLPGALQPPHEPDTGAANSVGRAAPSDNPPQFHLRTAAPPLDAGNALREATSNDPPSDVDVGSSSSPAPAASTLEISV